MEDVNLEEFYSRLRGKEKVTLEEDLCITDSGRYDSINLTTNLDGNGYTVYNVSDSLFNTIREDVVIKDISFKVVGECSDGQSVFCVKNNGTLKNVSFELDCESTCWIVSKNRGRIIDCGADVTMRSNKHSNDIVGGLCKKNFSLVTGCTVTGVFELRSRFGGIVGENLSVIENCEFSGNISVRRDCGGIVNTNSTGGEILNCTTTNSQLITTNDNRCGGVSASGDISSKIKKCCTVNTELAGETCGGIVAHNQGDIIRCSSKENELYSDKCSGGIVGHMETEGILKKSVFVDGKMDEGVSGGICGMLGGFETEIKQCYSDWSRDLTESNGSMLDTKITELEREGLLFGTIGKDDIEICKCFYIGDTNKKLIGEDRRDAIEKGEGTHTFDGTISEAKTILM